MDMRSIKELIDMTSRAMFLLSADAVVAKTYEDRLHKMEDALIGATLLFKAVAALPDEQLQELLGCDKCDKQSTCKTFDSNTKTFTFPVKVRE